MNINKIVMYAVGAVITVAVGLAIINRAKGRFPVIRQFIGE